MEQRLSSGSSTTQNTTLKHSRLGIVSTELGVIAILVIVLTAWWKASSEAALPYHTDASGEDYIAAMIYGLCLVVFLTGLILAFIGARLGKRKKTYITAGIVINTIPLVIGGLYLVGWVIISLLLDSTE